MKRFQLTRRHLLRGAGASLALPLLEAMPVRAQTQPPRRLLIFYVPNGMHMPEWTPTSLGDAWEPRRILAPLEPVRAHVQVISGLKNVPAMGSGGHARGTAGALSCRSIVKTDGANVSNGITMDQVAAAVLGKETRFASLQLGSEGGGLVGNCELGFSCAYIRNISWASASTPLPKLVDPRVVFQRLVGASVEATSVGSERERKRRLSVLDATRADALALQRQLGRSDAHKLEEYLTSVRELERRLASTSGPQCGLGAEPTPAEDWPAQVAQHLELMTLALRCDLTRVVTFMLNNAATQRNYGFIGAAGAHHELSHHGQQPEKHEKLTRIGRWEVEQFVSLVSRLASAQEGGGSVLDNSAVLFLSEFSDGDPHAMDNLPVLVAGRAGGALHPGAHRRFEGAPLARLHLSLLEAVGAPQGRFGEDGDQPLGPL